ncbi:MAG: dTDP-4-dehydrorhamnose 3,5-epimerase family protein, partial [Acidimicrobiales bacterium]
AANRTSLLVPPGCAHGYMTLTAGAEVSYLISAPYMEPAQRGVRWDDPTLDIRWPGRPQLIGERDAALPFISPSIASS